MLRCPCLLYLATAAWLASAPHFGAYVWHALAVLLFAPTLLFCCVPAHQRCGCGTALLLFVLLEAAFALALVNAEWEAARVCALDGAALPVWSRGFALCADVAPPAWEGGACERGTGRVAEWGAVRDGAVVYVPACNLPEFVAGAFAALNATARIVLVSGGEDVGVPLELWGGARRLVGSETPLSFGDASLRAFLCDARLAAWFVQNYDLAGRDAAALPRRCARKVRPLPIGADLHSRHERSPVHEPPCAQAQRLARLRAAAPPWSRRADRVLAAFTANQFGGRRQLRAALAALPPSTVLRPAGGLLAEQERQYAAVAAQASWRATAAAAFVAAPQGRGRDTHRVWESLLLGAVPVVLRSTLDELYAGFPVVVVDSWAELNASALRGWRARLGDDPFTAAVAQRLTLPYWCGRIRAPLGRSS